MIVPVAPRNRVPAEVLAVAGRPCHVRGGMLLAHLGWVEERHGRDAAQSLWTRLALPVALDAVTTHDWLPFDVLIAADKAICRTFAPGHEQDVAVALGRYSARKNLEKGLDVRKGASIHSHFWSGSAHHSRFQDFGSCTYVPVDDQAFRMEYRDYPVVSRVYCLSALGYFEGSLELLGGGDPIVEEASCQCYGDEACSFVVTWER